MINLVGAFDEFNPLEDELPTHMVWDFLNLSQRARALLPEDTNINSLNTYSEFAEIAFHFAYLKGISLAPSLQDRFEGSRLSINPLQMLFQYYEEAEQPSWADSLEGWKHVFSAIALAVISRSAGISGLDVESLFRIPTSIAEPSPIAACGKYSAEAVIYAEAFSQMADDKKLDQPRVDSIRRSRLAAYFSVKSEVCNLRNAMPPDISDNQAAKQIYGNLPEELKNKFVTDDPQNQIRVWLGQYRRGTIAGIEQLPTPMWCK